MVLAYSTRKLISSPILAKSARQSLAVASLPNKDQALISKHRAPKAIPTEPTSAKPNLRATSTEANPYFGDWKISITIAAFGV